MALTTIKAAAMAANSVDSDQYVDGSIDTAHIGDDQVTVDKLANAINTDIAAKAPKASPTFTGTVAIPNITDLEAAVTANTAKVTNATHTGDVTGSTALTIAAGAVETAMIEDDAVTADKLANSINTEIAANTAKVTNATHTGDVTGSGALTIADNAVTLAKMASGTDGQIITYDANGDPVHVGPGTDGQVLTSTGAGSPPAFEDAAGGAWNLITTVTASDSATVDVTGTSASYDRYCIIGTNVHGAYANDGYMHARAFDNGTIVDSGDYDMVWMVQAGTTDNPSWQREEAQTSFRMARCGDGSDNYTDFYLYFNSTHSGSTNLVMFQGHAGGLQASTGYYLQGAWGLDKSFTNISGVRT